MPDAVYFRQKAEQCRRLADGILAQDVPTGASLHALGVEFDARAAALEAETAAAMLIGYGDDIGDRTAPLHSGGDGKPKPS